MSRLSRFSLRVRLTSLFLAIFGTTLVAFSAFLYQVFVRNHENEFDAALFNYTVDVARSIDVNLFGELTLTPKILDESEKVFPFALGDIYLQLRTVRGDSIAKSRNLQGASLPFTLEDRDESMRRQAVFATVDFRDLKRGRGLQRFRLINYFIDKPGSFDFVLQIAAPMRLLERERRGLFTFLVSAVPLVLLVAAFSALYLTRRALKPVDDIIAKVRDITARQLSERFPVPRENDEVARLASTLNELLDRLERSFKSQEVFVADASHQLKTPLAILRGELDLMRTKERSPEELKEFLESASQEVSYLSRMVEDLLTLARMDTGHGSLSMANVRADELVIDAVARLEHIAKPKGVSLSLNLLQGAHADSDQSFVAWGDADLLRSLFESLIENAVKYSPHGLTVEVALDDLGSELLFSVRDYGPGIPPEMRERVFERFYRTESTRDKISGSGLGLAIVRRIVVVHGGKISIDAPMGGGTCFKVRLLKAPLQPVAATH